MYVLSCVCVCMHACMHVCIYVYVRVYVCTYVLSCLCMHACMHTYMHICRSISLHVCLLAHIQARMHNKSNICMRTHAYRYSSHNKCAHRYSERSVASVLAVPNCVCGLVLLSFHASSPESFPLPAPKTGIL
jgi:hypothetical protein